MTFARISGLVFSVFLLVSCASDTSVNPYQTTKVNKSLEVPPDLLNDVVKGKIALPTGFKQAQTDSPAILVEVESLELQGDAGFYWLTAAEPVETLYPAVKQFWASEGYPLIVDEPVLGIMQTEWNYKKEGTSDPDPSFLSGLFQSDDYSASQDQFKSRLERSDDGQSSKIYISHRGTEYNYRLLKSEQDSYKENEGQWRFTPGEAELEIEMLSRLMVYLGLQKAKVEEQSEQVQLYRERSSFQVDVKNQKSYLLIPYDAQRAWHRVIHQMDRMNLEISSTNTFGTFDNTALLGVITDIEEVQQGNLLSLFSDDERIVRKEVFLEISEETNRVSRIEIQTEDGSPDNSPEAIEFLRMLHHHLK